MDKTKNKQKTPRRAAYIALIVILGTLAFLGGIGSGVIQYGLSVAGCMKAPVAASSFMAGYSYDLPGDPGYGPSPFNKYYCTEQEAINAGFHR